MADLPGDETIEVIVRDSADSNKELAVSASGAASTNFTEVGGAAPSATNAIPVRPTNGTIYIDPREIIDGQGGGYKARVDAQFRLHTFSSPSVDTIPIQLHYLNLTSTPIEANQWQDVFTYPVPVTHNLGLTQFQIVSSQGGDDARIIQRISFGSFNTSTGVFTDGSAQIVPDFSAELYLRVTTLIGNVNDDTVTVTYTNQAGTGGRTAVGLVKKNSVVGTNIQLALQAGDIGIIDVTNVTHTVTQAGVVAVEGTTAIAYETAGVANIQTESVFGLNAAVVPNGSSVILQYNSSAGGAKVRRITAIASLIPV